MAQIPLKQLFLEYLREPGRFLEAHPNPWLVLSSAVRKKADLNLRTAVYSTEGKPVEQAPEDVELAALEVVKSEINAFALGITVGRTRNNDIAINDERISRFHAFFRPDGTGWLLSDANSKNGTFLDGQRLDPRKPLPLPDRAVLDFGGLRTRFFQPPAFVEFLRRSARRPPPSP